MIKDTNSTPSSNVTESEAFKNFKDLLEKIFELNKSDLDFGIYRILNIRNDKIKEFLSNDLPNKVKDALSSFNDPNYNMIALESDVYSALYTFFSRYYDEGDFISKRRYKEGVYAIPYEGEEVKLYWANQDQYYVKTSENFKDYTFKADDYLIHFRIVDATTEQNNNKESDDNTRVFMLFTEDEKNFPGIKTMEYNSEKKEITIRFIYEIQNKYTGKADTIIQKWTEDNFESIKEWLVNEQIPTWDTLLKSKEHKKDKKYCLLKKHLNAYVAKNTFDYFIHKDLKNFLTRELDFYIKSEIMHLDDLDTDNEQRVETYLGQIKAIKRVGNIIIDFLAQIENFQKKLWLKKKFVIETNWCITLDRIDEKFYPEIIENKAQILEWIDMYAVDEIKDDLTTVGFTNPPTVDFLRQNLNLVVDTKHFSSNFKERLIASIDNLDEQTGGLMINGENYQAMNTILCKEKGKLKAVVIDPPYNTEDDRIKGKFCYKDGFEDSSWIAMMFDRCSLLKQLQTNNGLIFVMIGDDECYNLKEILDVVYGGKSNFKANIIWNSRKSKQNDIDVSLSHNYVLSYSVKKSKNEYYGEPLNESEFSNPDNDPKGKWKTSPLDAPGVRERTSFFAITNPNTGVEYFPPKGRHWTIFQEDVDEYIKSGQIYFGNKGTSKPQWKRYWSEVCNDSKTISTIWDDVDTATDATKELRDILGSKPFETPKPVSLIEKIIQQSCNEHENIIDIFAGSATTGHATININRKYGGNRKYILVEMGDYFDAVTKLRMQKVIYSADWTDGKPKNRNTGVSHIMKYMKLESYEDALSNITLNDIDDIPSLLGNDYLINYMLDIESEGSILNLDAFNHPFEYKLKITENNEIKEKKIDIVETFNYLIGLTVQKSSVISFFNVVEDKNGEYEGAVQLIENTNGIYNFKHVTGTTPDGKRVLIIWRTISDNLIESNAALDTYFIKYCTDSQNEGYDIIYVNGDNNLQDISIEEDGFKVLMTEIEFKKRMFEEE